MVNGSINAVERKKQQHITNKKRMIWLCECNKTNAKENETDRLRNEVHWAHMNSIHFFFFRTKWYHARISNEHKKEMKHSAKSQSLVAFDPYFVYVCMCVCLYMYSAFSFIMNINHHMLWNKSMRYLTEFYVRFVMNVSCSICFFFLPFFLLFSICVSALLQTYLFGHENGYTHTSKRRNFFVFYFYKN